MVGYRLPKPSSMVGSNRNLGVKRRMGPDEDFENARGGIDGGKEMMRCMNCLDDLHSVISRVNQAAKAKYA